MAGVEGPWGRPSRRPTAPRILVTARYLMAPIVLAFGCLQLTPLAIDLAASVQGQSARRAASGLVAMAQGANPVQLLLWLAASLLFIQASVELIRPPEAKALAAFCAALVVESAGWATFVFAPYKVVAIPEGLRHGMPLVLAALGAALALLCAIEAFTERASLEEGHAGD